MKTKTKRQDGHDLQAAYVRVQGLEDFDTMSPDETSEINGVLSALAEEIENHGGKVPKW